MASRAPTRTASRRLPRAVVAGVLAGMAAMAAVPLYHWQGSSSSSIASPSHLPTGHQVGAPGEGGGVLRTGRGGALGEADGAVPDGASVFDDDVPGVAKLEPALLAALRQAATAAADDGITFVVDSGWRSRAYQEQLLEEAVAKYGSEAEAARWVATPDTSAHVSGDAVDLGPGKATAWLSRHGVIFGLCQIYRNEPWHYERHPDAIRHGCPRMYSDPTQDPRMRH